MIQKDKTLSPELVEVLKSTLTIHDETEIWIQSGVSKATLLKIRYGDAYLSNFGYEAAVHLINYAISKCKEEIRINQKNIEFLTKQIPADRIQQVNTIRPNKYKRKR